MVTVQLSNWILRKRWLKSLLVYKGRFAAPWRWLFSSILFLYPTSYFILVDKVTKAPLKEKHLRVFPLKNPLFLISALSPPQSRVIYISFSRFKCSNFFPPATKTLRYGTSSTQFDSATNKIFFFFSLLTTNYLLLTSYLNCNITFGHCSYSFCYP